MVAQSDPFSVLHQWLSREEDFFTKLRINPISPTNRILTTIDYTPPNTILLQLPRTHTRTTTDALSDPKITQILTTHPPPLPTTKESAALLLHNILLYNGHAFKPWLDTLPSTIVTATTTDSITALLNTPLYPLAETLRAELDCLYNDWYIPITQSYPQDFPQSLIPKSVFLHAHGIMESRAFLLDGTATITPYLDMCNHSLTPNAVIRTTDTPSAIQLIATTAIPGNTEITISYGQLSNLDLLLHWGFALPQNRNDRVMVTFEPSEDVAKVLILSVCVSDTEFVLCEEDPLPEELVKAARILVLEDAELVGGVKRDYREIVNAPAERRAMTVLRETVQRLRCGYVDADDEFGSFCVIYRMGVEKILDMAASRIDDMENGIGRL